jgi:hypothetical protein
MGSFNSFSIFQRAKADTRRTKYLKRLTDRHARPNLFKTLLLARLPRPFTQLKQHLTNPPDTLGGLLLCWLTLRSPESYSVTCYRDNVRLQNITIDSATRETLSKASFSSDQNFILAQEFCPLLKDQYVEVILFKGQTMGEHTFYYFNGKIKRQGININGYVGK